MKRKSTLKSADEQYNPISYIIKKEDVTNG